LQVEVGRIAFESDLVVETVNHVLAKHGMFLLRGNFSRAEYEIVCINIPLSTDFASAGELSGRARGTALGKSLKIELA
jgi:hypothetical protein